MTWTLESELWASLMVTSHTSNSTFFLSQRRAEQCPCSMPSRHFTKVLLIDLLFMHTKFSGVKLSMLMQVIERFIKEKKQLTGRVEWWTSENYILLNVYLMDEEQSEGFNTIFSALSFYQATMAILVTQCKAKAWEKASILLIFDQLRLSFQTAILCSRIGGLEITQGWVTTNNWRGILFSLSSRFLSSQVLVSRNLYTLPCQRAAIQQ